MNIPTLAIDFDGTVVRHAYPEIGEPVPGAIEWLEIYQRLECRLILWTMRSQENAGVDTLTPAVRYLSDAGIKLWGVNQNPGQGDWSSSPKAYAHLYIDDAAAGCPLVWPGNGHRPHVDWSIIGPAVEKQVRELLKAPRW